MGLADMMSREAEMLKSMEAWESEGMTMAESAHYLEVTGCIYQRLAEVV